LDFLWLSPNGLILVRLQTLRRVSGTSQESVVREAFKTLLKDWGKSRDLIFLPEYEYETLTKTRVRPDGTLMYALRVPFGYWEAKDTDDDLDQEIEKKFRKNYPQDNIIFDDSHDAVLIQNKQQVMRCGVEDPAQLQRLLELYFGYERPEIADFREAVEQFKADLPAVLKALREMIDAAERDNPTFHQAAIKFLKHAQETINPNVVAADVREMLIQHILTEEIFSQVFDNSDFHRHNNVAKQLYALEETFFAGGLKQKTLAGLRPYYAAIKSAAALVTSHHEKQTFLKVIYENFYKVYDKKKADRLGVAYTPNEIVRFMVEGADWLCQKHFGKALIDKNVEILDPCVGTGTFITEIIEHFRGQPTKLRYKYLEELHCNEVAILPYYVANLNIEATYAAIARNYGEYPNLCFVDTLDNTAALKAQKNQHFGDLFGGMSEENVARISRQNKKKISVIIGNPPYNANQLNENENNKNREYPEIDRRIKATYIAASTAQKTKLYDMYARFFRWASDRVDENGIIAFVSNSSFIDSRTYDGFRKVVAEDFNEIWIVDLKGNARTSGERRRREGGNVFDDQIRVGVAVYFCVKKKGAHGCRIQYEAVRDYAKSDEKREFLHTPLGDRTLGEIRPDAENNWINVAQTDFDALVPIADKGTKAAKIALQERSIFKLFSLGVVTNRDEWTYDDDTESLKQKVRFLINTYNADVGRLSGHTRSADVGDAVDKTIKWTRAVKKDLLVGRRYDFDSASICNSFYRPFVKRKLYFDRHLNEMVYQVPQLFGPKAGANLAFAFSAEERSEFGVIAFDEVPNKDIFMPSAAQVLARYRYADGHRIDNITDWGLDQFRAHYEGGKAPKHRITKDAIFQYVYGVLHDPLYREKYALNLKREFPRIPFHADFWKWAEWGEKLMALHIGYETVEPWPLERTDALDEKSRKAGLRPKAMLKANKDTGSIQLDSETQLTGAPAEAWTYKLGNRSALEWIIDQYKEKTPKDPTIREKFNTYRFADHKEKVIDLLKRVTRVSVETMKIVEAMRAESCNLRTYTPSRENCGDD
jgi:predicted helicase